MSITRWPHKLPEFLAGLAALRDNLAELGPTPDRADGEHFPD